MNLPRRSRLLAMFSPSRRLEREVMRVELKIRAIHLLPHTTEIKVADLITADGVQVDGAFTNGRIAIALDGTDVRGTLDHECIHALRAADAFSAPEWEILCAEAALSWRKKFDIDRRYAGLREGLLQEEAVADAFKEWCRRREIGPRVIVLFYQACDALSAIQYHRRSGRAVSVQEIFAVANRGDLAFRCKRIGPI